MDDAGHILVIAGVVMVLMNFASDTSTTKLLLGLATAVVGGLLILADRFGGRGDNEGDEDDTGSDRT